MRDEHVICLGRYALSTVQVSSRRLQRGLRLYAQQRGAVQGLLWSSEVHPVPQHASLLALCESVFPLDTPLQLHTGFSFRFPAPSAPSRAPLLRRTRRLRSRSAR